MNTVQRVALGVGVVAVLVVCYELALTGYGPREYRAYRASLNAADVCRGVPALEAAPYDPSRQGIHLLAEAGRPAGTWPGWDSTVPAGWYAQRLSEVELALCFAAESVVVDTCEGYSTHGGWAASDVVLAKQRWSVRLLEARTGRVVDRLRVEGPSVCPSSVGESLTYLLVEGGDGPEGAVALWDWVTPFVEPGLPGPRYRRACDGGNMLACSNLGLMYANGRGVSPSDTRAVELYERACDGGEMGGCARLGAMYASGRGVPQSETRAAELYRRACDGGHSVSCDWLSRFPGVRP